MAQNTEYLSRLAYLLDKEQDILIKDELKREFTRQAFAVLCRDFDEPIGSYSKVKKCWDILYKDARTELTALRAINIDERVIDLADKK